MSEFDDLVVEDEKVQDIDLGKVKEYVTKDSVKETENKEIIRITLMTMTPIVIYPNGNRYIEKSKCRSWIQESRTQPKSKKKVKKKGKEAKIQEELKF